MVGADMDGINVNKSDVSERLSPQQIESLVLLAASVPAKEVAAKVGVTPQTISVWLNHDGDFRHALWVLKKEALDAARSELQLAAIEAATVIRTLLRDGSTEHVRLKAAELLVDRLDLLGRYSDKGFDGPAVTQSGDYAPPSRSELRSIQSREARRQIKEVFDGVRRRLGIVDPDGIPRYGSSPVVGGDILDSEDTAKREPT
jgi:hypothetical protein